MLYDLLGDPYLTNIASRRICPRKIMGDGHIKDASAFFQAAELAYD
jgi:hypothetical protein